LRVRMVPFLVSGGVCFTGRPVIARFHNLEGALKGFAGMLTPLQVAKAVRFVRVTGERRATSFDIDARPLTGSPSHAVSDLPPMRATGREFLKIVPDRETGELLVVRSLP
jgi:hypothetical protein